MARAAARRQLAALAEAATRAGVRVTDLDTDRETALDKDLNIGPADREAAPVSC